MSKKIHTIFIIVFFALVIGLFISIGCSRNLSLAEKEIEKLKLEIAQLEDKTREQEDQLSKHNTLTKNLNKLLSTVYYGIAVPEMGGREKNFTAFSMFYKNDFYLITAGHCIEYEGIKYTDFKFKANSSSSWIFPELLYYETSYYENRDFAIFYIPNIRKGLIVDEEDQEPKYVLGNTERRLNYFKEFSDAVEGESGSPILSSSFKLVGIVIKNNSDYTPISEVTRAIDLLIEQ